MLALAIGAVGCFSVAHSLAQVLAKSDAGSAYALAPYDGRIAGHMAASLITQDAPEAIRRRADALARRALGNDPTAVTAVSTLGIDAQLRGDAAAARRLFGYSQQLSRRDFQTQAWAIEDAVGRGDIAAALRHYDISLRTTPEASELLYPVLTSATADPAIQDALARTLAGRPRWGEDFINYAAAKSADPRSALRFFARLRGAGVTVSGYAGAELVNRLITGGFIDEAWSYYASLRPGADRRTSRDPGFAGVATPSSLDWIALNEGGISTSIQRAHRGGIFEFAAPPSIGGPLLQQAQMLPPGDYRLEGHSIGIDQPEGARPYWLLTCRDGREAGRAVLPNSVEGNGNFAGRFSVPSGCPVQTLVLMARASDTASGLSGQIDRVQLSPVR